jgi:lauroyl/myristoyl acyltransferase
MQGFFLLLLLYPLRWLVRRLPWRQALRVGTLLGTLHARCVHDQLYRQIHDGIRTVWADELAAAELEALVRRNLVMRYQHLINGFFYHTLDETLAAQLVPTITGRTHLDHALSRGKGAILLVSHFGAFGLLLAGLVFRGYQLQQIFTLTPQPHYRTWRWMERAIMQAKLQCWPRDRLEFTFWRPGLYLRPLYRKLQAGGVVVLYGDGARGEQFTRVDFLGHPLALSAGPFRIAARAQVPLIPAFIVREADDRHRIILEQPILLPDAALPSLQRGAEQYAALLSRYVRGYPDHWFTWARLRRRPEAGDGALELAAPEVERTHFYTATTRQDA